MKKIFFLLLVTTFSFSQNKTFTMEQIDSICLKSKEYIEQKFELEREYNMVSSKKTKRKVKIKSAGFLNIYRLHLNNTKIDSMMLKSYNYKILEPEIIKATYEYDIVYNKNRIENAFIEFYYNDNKIDYIRVQNNYYKGNYNVIIKNLNSNTFKQYNNYFSFCESFKYWVEDISNKVNNVFNETKWEK